MRAGGKLISLVFSGSAFDLPVSRIVLGNSGFQDQPSQQVFRSFNIFKGIVQYDPDIINFLTGRWS